MKLTELNGHLVWVHKCKRCLALSELYDEWETVQKNQEFARRNPDTLPFQSYTLNGLADKKKRLKAKIDAIEEKRCECEAQLPLLPPSSNTGVKIKTDTKKVV